MVSAGGGGGGIIRARRISELIKLYLQRRGWLIHRHHDYLLFLDHLSTITSSGPQDVLNLSKANFLERLTFKLTSFGLF